MIRIATTVCLLLSTTLAQAGPPGPPGPNAPRYYDFAFSFENTAYGGATVEGVVRGLGANGTSAATSVEILSHGAAYGIGEFIGDPFVNAWTVSNGTIQGFDFFAPGVRNDPPFVTTATLLMGDGSGEFADDAVGLAPFADGAGGASVAATGLSFTVLRAYHHLPGDSPTARILSTLPADVTGAAEARPLIAAD